MESSISVGGYTLNVGLLRRRVRISFQNQKCWDVDALALQRNDEKKHEVQLLRLYFIFEIANPASIIFILGELNVQGKASIRHEKLKSDSIRYTFSSQCTVPIELKHIPPSRNTPTSGKSSAVNRLSQETRVMIFE